MKKEKIQVWSINALVGLNTIDKLTSSGLANDDNFQDGRHQLLCVSLEVLHLKSMKQTNKLRKLLKVTKENESMTDVWCV